MIILTKIIRTALFLVSSKQGRETITRVVVIALCVFLIPVIIISGFIYTFFSFYGGFGGNDDVYSQAVSEVKSELEIDNDLQPAVLRAVYSKLYGTLEADKQDVKDMITTYFVKSEEKEHTVTKEDIEKLDKQIEELKKQISKEEAKEDKNEETILKLNESLSELNEKSKELKEKYEDEQKPAYHFLEIQEIKALLSAPPFSFDDKYITELENFILYIGNNSSIDFGDIDFSHEAANDTQKKIVAVSLSAADYGIYATEGACEKWVADIYLEVLGTRGYAPSALEAGRMWSVSSDWSKIQIGAAVYGTASQQYGHVGIYIGNGMVIHNLDGYVKKESLESWVKAYNGKCWGWENGQNLTGNPEYDCIGGLI